MKFIFETLIGLIAVPVAITHATIASSATPHSYSGTFECPSVTRYSKGQQYGLEMMIPKSFMQVKIVATAHGKDSYTLSWREDKKPRQASLRPFKKPEFVAGFKDTSNQLVYQVMASDGSNSVMQSVHFSTQGNQQVLQIDLQQGAEKLEASYCSRTVGG